MIAPGVGRQIVRVGVFGALTGLMLPAYGIAMARARAQASHAVRDRWTSRWAKGLLTTFGLRVRIIGDRAPLPAGGLVVSNHQSAADIGVLLALFGGSLVSRADLAGWPLIGRAARSTGTIFVDRASAASGIRAIQEVTTRLRGGDRVCAFPEGTTHGDGEVHAFHHGLFAAARRARTHVVPVGIAYAPGSGAAFVDESFTKHLERMSRAEPSSIHVRIGAPIDARLGDIRALTQSARNATRALFLEARSAFDIPRR